jgi:hypothetical protein
MDQIDTTSAVREPSRRRLGLDRLRLRFRDPALESAFRADQFRHHLGNIRFAFLAGIVLWISWGLLLRPYILALSELRLDRIMRLGVFIPMLVIGLALTFTPFFGRIWEWVAVAIATATIGSWVFYTSNIQTLPAEYGYVGVILITAFTYTLLRLRFVLVLPITLIGIGAYLPYAFATRYVAPVSGVLATLYLVSFGFLGGLAAHRMERFTRTLFLRERRSTRSACDPTACSEHPAAGRRRPAQITSGRRIAQAFEQVTVIFVDAVGSTQQAARSSPDEFAHALTSCSAGSTRSRPAWPREGEDDRRRVHGRRRRAGRDGRSCGSRRRDGRRRHPGSGCGPMAVGRPDRRPRRCGHRAGRRRRDRAQEVRLRPVGRHREPREQTGGAGRAG